MSVASTSEQSLEARTLRRVAVRALPFLMALYFVNYLDRTREHVWHVAIQCCWAAWPFRSPCICTAGFW